MRLDESGISGVIEIVVAVVILGLLFPMIAITVGALTNNAASLSAGSVVQASQVTALTNAQEQLAGAQPAPYCSDPAGAGGSSPNYEAYFSTAESACPVPAQGPPAAVVAAAAVGANVPVLPYPPASTCSNGSSGFTPSVGPGSLVVANNACVGFFSYDFEGSATGSGQGAVLNPPSLVYIYQANRQLSIASYTPSGTQSGTTCASGTLSYTNPCWGTAAGPATPSATRVITPLVPGTPFSFFNSSQNNITAVLSTDCSSGGSRTACLSDLANVQMVTIAVSTTYGGSGGTASPASDTQVVISGNAYSSNTTP
jgi:type II secretory pathway pseudopilin PulG